MEWAAKLQLFFILFFPTSSSSSYLPYYLELSSRQVYNNIVDDRIVRQTIDRRDVEDENWTKSWEK